VRHAKPVELAGFHCPKCEKGICHGTLRRVEPDAIGGLSITCPRCGFDGVADVELTH
jgi:hypothetical protein